RGTTTRTPHDTALIDREDTSRTVAPLSHGDRFLKTVSYRKPPSPWPCNGVSKWSTTKSATSRPNCSPLTSSKRKCCPAKIRLNDASSSAAEKLVNERTTPGRTSEVTSKSKRPSFRNDFSTYAPAALITAWAPG